MREFIRILLRYVWQYRLHILCLAAGAALGFLAAYVFLGTRADSDFAVREYDERYQFIRRLLICQVNEEEESREFGSLERRVEKQIALAQQSRKIRSTSVYFRELDTGKWMGVDEDRGYTPASLLKVPIMMSYFKESQTDPDALTNSYTYTHAGEEDVLIKKPLLVSGKSYSALDLIRGMIIQSDNSAMYLLQEHADAPTLEETYNILGIKDPYSSSQDTLYQISAKQYGLFFRVLYNGTFLSRDLSNQALEILSESEFDLGLRAGTPEGIPVSHKYGVSGFTRDDGSHGVELSDCGIIYNSVAPYLLCIMTDGDNPYVQAEVIKEIAQTVSDAVITDTK